MEQEYTKGEWKREGNEVKVLGSGTVAIFPLPTTSDGVLEFIANAQLIASAPDLYEALEDIVGELDKQDKIGLKLLNSKIHARQALAKAEGK